MAFTEALLLCGKRSLTLGFDGNRDIFWHWQSGIDQDGLCVFLFLANCFLEGGFRVT